MLHDLQIWLEVHICLKRTIFISVCCMTKKSLSFLISSPSAISQSCYFPRSLACNADIVLEMPLWWALSGDGVCRKHCVFGSEFRDIVDIACPFSAATIYESYEGLGSVRSLAVFGMEDTIEIVGQGCGGLVICDSRGGPALSTSVVRASRLVWRVQCSCWHLDSFVRGGKGIEW